MTTPDMLMDVSDDSVTPEPEGSAASGVFIQHGLRNEAIISRPIHGQVTQVGRENIINICTEMKTFQFKISSKQTDVEAVVAINMIPDKDLDPTKTLVLGQETTESEITTGEEIIIRIECDEQAKRQRNGYTIGGDLRSKTRRILMSLFEGLNMFVNYFRRGSIIIGLQPQTDRAVFTLLNAMEGGFIEELVRGILENEPDWNIDDDLNEPIKMKIDINIPQGMFPKEFPCKKFESRKELLQELKVSLQRKKKVQEETVEKEIDFLKSSAPIMSLDESRTLMSEMDEDILTRKDYVTDINETTEENPTFKRISREENELRKRILEYRRLLTELEERKRDRLKTSAPKRSLDKLRTLMSEMEEEILTRKDYVTDINETTKWWRMWTEIEETSKALREELRLIKATEKAEKDVAAGISKSVKKDVLMGSEKKTADIAHSKESKDFLKSSAPKMSLDELKTLMSEMDEEMSTRKDDVTDINETTEENPMYKRISRKEHEFHKQESEYWRMRTEIEKMKALEKKIRLMRAGGIAGAAAVGAVIAGPVGAAIGGFALGTYWVISDLWSSYSRRNTQN